MDFGQYIDHNQVFDHLVIEYENTVGSPKYLICYCCSPDAIPRGTLFADIITPNAFRTKCVYI